MASSSPVTEAQRIIYLTLQYINGTISFAELQELDTWKNANDENLLLFEELVDESNRTAAIEHMQQLDVASALGRVNHRIDLNAKPKYIGISGYMRIAAAVAAILVLITGILFYNNNRIKIINTQAGTVRDVMPGGNKATLKLSDGTVITLNEQKNGTLVKQSGINIIKTSDGQLVYQSEDPGNSKSIAYNTITTPNGGQYQVRLPDGSEVWLNAASSLTYESSINKGAERRVKLSGEAYFQVAHDSKRPFTVQTATQEVKVLGTDFNINSYVDEYGQRTTLLEGRVEVSIPGTSLTTVLKPQEQSIYRDGKLNKQRVDTELAVAWKNGKLKFDSADIRQIMRQVARWYDVDILYKGKIPEDTFTGAINRQSNLSTVLKMFDASQIHFKLEEIKGKNTLIIQP